MNKKITEKTISQVVIEVNGVENTIADIVLPLSQVVTTLIETEGTKKESLENVLSWNTFGQEQQ